ncbi:centrosomal protein of 68 kDa [Brachyhypopomus gauderio]|uniref:centrosomal protein of 68 kDa n=1 Tax=Brachyhypopomus gauderio TaxID=698409 RepID=UPI004041B25B
MALEVDGALSDTFSLMEHKDYGRWRRRIPESLHSGHTRPLTPGDGLNPPHDQDVKDSDSDRSVIKKTVTMAPTSRYMTGRTYCARKPMITAEHKISILKNPLTQECSETIHMSSVASYQESEGLLFMQSDGYTAENTNISQSSLPSVSKEDCYASLSISDLKSSVPSACVYEGRSLSSPSLDDLNLTVPLSPKLTSTQKMFSNSCITQTYSSPKTKTGASKQEADSFLNTHSSLSYSKGYSSAMKNMSPYQANYWACVIPSSLPPSPDRKSPSWNPDKEYQELLDYTYPLRPECRPLTHTDPLLQDSGVELDQFHSSSSLSCLEKSMMKIRQDRDCLAASQRLSEWQSLNLRKLSPSKSSDGRISSNLYSSLDQVGLSVESLDFEGKQNFHYRKFGIFCSSKSAPTFIRSTYILPRHGSLGDLDEEFLRLPEQLKELQVLSHELNDITAEISQPVTTSWERESASLRSSSAQRHKYTPTVTVQEKSGEEDHGSVSEVPLQSKTFSEQVKGLGARLQMISSQVNRGNLRDVEAIVDQLSGTSTASQSKTGSEQSAEDNKKSLLQHIQVFCSNLEELIKWLYKVVEKMESLSPPSVNMESVKASLADYKNFQKEVQAHRPLTASVLQSGEMLLCCMNSASPFLQETLMLIERQSSALEAHSEHLFSSILSAMDSLTEPSIQGDTVS